MHKGGSIASDSVQYLVSEEGYEMLNDEFTNNSYVGEGGCGCSSKKIGGKNKKVSSKKVTKMKKNKKGGTTVIDTTVNTPVHPPIPPIPTYVHQEMSHIPLSGGKYRRVSGGMVTPTSIAVPAGIAPPPAGMPPIPPLIVHQEMTQLSGGRRSKPSKYAGGYKNTNKYNTKHITELSGSDDYQITNQKGGNETEVIQLNYNDIPLSDSMHGQYQSRDISPEMLESIADSSVGVPFTKTASYGSVSDNATTGQVMPFSYATGGGKKKALITFSMSTSIPVDQAKALKLLLKLSGSKKVTIMKDKLIAEYSKTKDLTNAIKNIITPLQKAFANKSLRSSFV